jgi:thioredoxin reductase
MDTEMYDCVVVGAGAAGLSAALVLGRARVKTLVVDAGTQSNLPSTGIGGLLGADQMEPATFYERARAEVGKYAAVELRDGTVERGAREAASGPFTLTLAGGGTVSARRVLLATGMTYNYPEVPGFAEAWGHDVFHCPFCHGWEHRDRPLGVLAGGGSGHHRALLLKQWSDDVTLYINCQDEDLTEEQLDDVWSRGIKVETRPLRHFGESVVTLGDGTTMPCEGMLVPVTLHQRSPLAEQLGAELSSEVTPLHADAIVANPMQTGLAAAGDAAGIMPSVANAVAAGSNAASMIVGSLVLAPRALTGSGGRAA